VGVQAFHSGWSATSTVGLCGVLRLVCVADRSGYTHQSCVVVSLPHRHCRRVRGRTDDCAIRCERFTSIGGRACPYNDSHRKEVNQWRSDDGRESPNADVCLVRIVSCPSAIPRRSSVQDEDGRNHTDRIKGRHRV